MLRFLRNYWNQRRSLAIAGLAAMALCWQLPVQAQTQTPPAKTDNTDDIKTPFLDNYTPSDEVKRRALGPLRIIKQLGDQKKAAPAASPAPAPAAKPHTEETARAPAKANSAAPSPAPVSASTAPPAASVAVAVPPPSPAPQPVAVAPTPAPVAEVAPRQPNLELIPVRQDTPVYSHAVLHDIDKGQVTVAFDVNPDGSTSAVQITSSTNRRLNSAVMDAVGKWKFKPIDETVRVEVEVGYSVD